MKQGIYRVTTARSVHYTKAEREKLVLRAKRSGRGGGSHSTAGFRYRNFIGKSGRGK